MAKPCYARRKAAGQCVRCTDPVEPGRTKCAACRLYDLENKRRRLADRRARGICSDCSSPATRGAHCEAHYQKSKSKPRGRSNPEKQAVYMRRYHDKLRAQGLCLNCRRPAENARCKECTAKKNARRKPGYWIPANKRRATRRRAIRALQGWKTRCSHCKQLGHKRPTCPQREVSDGVR